MKFTKQILIFVFAALASSCGTDEARLTVVNLQSFPEKQVAVDTLLAERLLADSAAQTQTFAAGSAKLARLIQEASTLRENQNPGNWQAFLTGWEDFRSNAIATGRTPLSAGDSTATDLQAWAQLNIGLLKLSGEVRFADAVEDLLYSSSMPVLTGAQLKSVIYTHIDDQIFINLPGSSSLTHAHTTGGTVKLIQETSYPATNTILLKCESTDKRYLDVFIRIPSSAVNPTVTHGNVKYVARPGEYCQISRKWNTGDEILVSLRN